MILETAPSGTVQNGGNEPDHVGTAIAISRVASRRLSLPRKQFSFGAAPIARLVASEPDPRTMRVFVVQVPEPMRRLGRLGLTGRPTVISSAMSDDRILNAGVTDRMTCVVQRPAATIEDGLPSVPSACDVEITALFAGLLA